MYYRAYRIQTNVDMAKCGHFKLGDDQESTYEGLFADAKIKLQISTSILNFLECKSVARWAKNKESVLYL